MSSAERLAIERAKRQLQAAHQQMASALVTAEVVIDGLQGALDSDDASRALGQVAWRRNYEARRQEVALVPAQRTEAPRG